MFSTKQSLDTAIAKIKAWRGTKYKYDDQEHYIDPSVIYVLAVFLLEKLIRRSAIYLYGRANKKNSEKLTIEAATEHLAKKYSSYKRLKEGWIKLDGPDSKRAIFTVMTFLAQWFLAAKIRNLISLPPVLLYQSDDSHILEIFCIPLL